MALSAIEELNAGRSPYPGRGLGGDKIAAEGHRNGAGRYDGRLDERYLQQAGGLRLLARLTGFAMLAGTVHVLATVWGHIHNYRSARRLHRARICRQRRTRHCTEGQRQANQANQTKSQVTFHTKSLAAANGRHHYSSVSSNPHNTVGGSQGIAISSGDSASRTEAVARHEVKY
jgi:hypothetical protein